MQDVDLAREPAYLLMSNSDDGTRRCASDRVEGFAIVLVVVMPVVFATNQLRSRDTIENENNGTLRALESLTYSCTPFACFRANPSLQPVLPDIA